MKRILSIFFLLLADIAILVHAVVLTAVDEKCVGAIALSDIIRSNAAAVVAELERMGVEAVVLTGDSQSAAKYMAGRIGIGNIRAELLPSGKVSAIAELQRNGKNVCMIGDGVNDAPH